MKILRKSLILVTLSLIFTLMLRHPAVAATAKPYNELQFPPLPEIQLPDYEQYQLNNGMTIYLVEDHRLPLVKGSAIIRTGSRLEPGEKTGLGEITGEVIRSGGTLKHNPDQLNAILEQKAAEIETSIDETSGTASFDVLSEDLEQVFGLFAEVLREPAFPQDKLDLTKTQVRGAIARRNDDPDDIASREFSKLIYGNNSPYGRTVEYSTLDQIQRQDLINFYQQYYRPDQVILGIVGDFQPKKMKKLIEQTFGDWQNPDTVTLIDIPSATQQHQQEVFFVDQPQLTQSSVRLGHLGGELNSPDYPALSVLNGIFNGFGGRLFNEVRSRQGLAYSVYGYWSARYDYPGIFISGGQTRSEATVPFIKAVLSELEKLRTTAVSEQELSYAKESILNSFIFNFEDPAQTLSRLLRYQYFGYPANFIFDYQRGVKATTTADVLRVAQTYLKPEQLVTLVVGNKQQITPFLDTLDQEVTAIDVTIPEQ